MPTETCPRDIKTMALPMYKIRTVMLLLGYVSIASYAQQHGVNLNTSASDSKPVIINTDNPAVRIDFDLPPIDNNTIPFSVVGHATVTGRAGSYVYLEFAPSNEFGRCTEYDICSYPNTQGAGTLDLNEKPDNTSYHSGKLTVDLMTLNKHIEPGKYVIKMQGWELDQ